jgi:hypothetical protein
MVKEIWGKNMNYKIVKQQAGDRFSLLKLGSLSERNFRFHKTAKYLIQIFHQYKETIVIHMIKIWIKKSKFNFLIVIYQEYTS